MNPSSPYGLAFNGWEVALQLPVPPLPLTLATLLACLCPNPTLKTQGSEGLEEAKPQRGHKTILSLGK